MRVFLSYASEDRLVADQLRTALITEGHTVFQDHREISAGDAFHKRLRHEISKADLFVFLASVHSVSTHSYALSELVIAQSQWPNPEGRVFSALLPSVSVDELPGYVRAVSAVCPKGDFVAEVTAAIANISRKRRFYSNAITLGLSVFASLLSFSIIVQLFLPWASSIIEPDMNVVISFYGPRAALTFNLALLAWLTLTVWAVGRVSKLEMHRLLWLVVPAASVAFWAANWMISQNDFFSLHDKIHPLTSTLGIFFGMICAALAKSPRGAWPIRSLTERISFDHNLFFGLLSFHTSAFYCLYLIKLEIYSLTSLSSIGLYFLPAFFARDYMNRVDDLLLGSFLQLSIYLLLSILAFKYRRLSTLDRRSEHDQQH